MKTLKTVVSFLALGAIGGYGLYAFQSHDAVAPIAIETPQAGMEAEADKLAEAVRQVAPSYEGSSTAGSYLSGRFAQRHHDWRTASRYIDYVLKNHPDDPDLLKREMVLSMGAGDYEDAFSTARLLLENHGDTTALSHMFLTADAFKHEDYAGAQKYIANMPEGGLTSFIRPLLHSWAQASVGDYDINALRTNGIHLYHAILVSLYMDKTDDVRGLLQRVLGSGEIGTQDLERIADIYARLGEYESALKLLDQALLIEPDDVVLKEKREAAAAATFSPLFVHADSPAHGIGEAFYDMGRLLAQDLSDESARIFIQVALHLNPQLTNARLLLAQIAARNERYDDAIALYKSIDENNISFLEARRYAAEILKEQGRVDEAIAELEELIAQHEDLDAQIHLGDIYRQEERFQEAIAEYNKAEKQLGEIGPDHWHLYYVRGMSYEQDGDWEKAEADLQAALSFRPDHPYVLNYLGYAWADQGENLEEALKMIARAVEVRPGDGYITDSLGWVYYRMGRYKEAVPHLEQAVELMPYDPVINDHLGDAYWKVGRALEAEFQWTRAKNHAEEAELIEAIEAKLARGMDEGEAVKAAQSDTPATFAPKNQNEGEKTNAVVQ